MEGRLVLTAAHIIVPKGIGSRVNRIAPAIAALLAYLLCCLTLVRFGYLDAAGSVLYPLLGVWSVGLLVLMLTEPSVARFDAGALTFIKALWFNIGAVCTALFVPDMVRLAMLVVPLFGVLYSALHLDRRHMIAVGVITWSSYLIGVLGLQVTIGIGLGTSAAPDEAMLLIAFTLMLAAMVYMGGEVT
ncbi:MAG: hypothetical protein OES38_17270, partial [Gammaproteobacteria bacterium]|nr:hypothetical protein [Gammaproteobacteria bacterium]